ncbi:MAG: hypothetical protein QNL04_04450 [SAR324 cluster bacterium]|nr:hypothetical protein [SAR324 cluster bacterium]
MVAEMMEVIYQFVDYPNQVVADLAKLHCAANHVAIKANEIQSALSYKQS